MGDDGGVSVGLKDWFKVVTGAAGAASDVVVGTTRLLSGDVDGAVAKSQKFLVDGKKFLDGAAGIRADLVQVAKKFGDNPLVKGANSPPLVYGQMAITAMKATTGFGDPEDGADFKKSADLFGEAVETMIDAEPKPDRWDGTAAAAYAEANAENRRRTSDMNAADQKMQSILGTEAGQLTETRKTLTDWSNYLYDFGLATAWLNLVPGGGAAAKLVLDTGAAATALGVTGYAMQNMVRDSLDNASKVRELVAIYQRAADEKEPNVSACDPFPPDSGQPRKPPSRVDPSVPNLPPAEDNPQPQFPPATPLGTAPPAPAPAPSSPPGAAPPAAAPPPVAAPAAFHAPATTAASLPTGAPISPGGAMAAVQRAQASLRTATPAVELPRPTADAPSGAVPATDGARSAATGERAPVTDSGRPSATPRTTSL